MPLANQRFAFIDVASIHQVDEDMKERGIYGLGGFLKASKELRILWSPPYLSRRLSLEYLILFERPASHLFAWAHLCSVHLLIFA